MAPEDASEGQSSLVSTRPFIAFEGSYISRLHTVVFRMPASPAMKSAPGPAGERVREAFERRELWLPPDDVTGQRRPPGRRAPGS